MLVVVQEGQAETAAAEAGGCAHCGGFWGAVQNGGPATQGSGYAGGVPHEKEPSEQCIPIVVDILCSI